MAFHEFDVAAVSDFDRLAVFAGHCAEFDVGIVEHGEYVVCRTCDFAHLCEDVFLCFGKHVRFLTERVSDGEFVFF